MSGSKESSPNRKKKPPLNKLGESLGGTYDAMQFFKEEKYSDAIFNVYLKKVLFHVDSDMCLDNEDDKKGCLLWRLEEVRVIKCGTLDRLISALCSEIGEMESINVNTFLATYRTFSSAKDVLQSLIRRYTDMDNDSTLKQLVKETFKRTLKTILMVWLDLYSEDFRDPPEFKLLHSLQDFARKHTPDSELCQKSTEKLDQFKSEGSHLLDSTTILNGSCRLKKDVNANYCTDLERCDFEMIPSRFFAEQLTFMDAELFKKVVPHHCLGSVWSRRCKKNNSSLSTQSISVQATVDQFNAVTYRVIATVLKPPMTMSAYDRASIIEKWIDIAQECRSLKNFSSLKAILSALQSISIHRLHQVWGLVCRHKQWLFEELAAIFSEENNQKKCRDLLNREGTAKSAEKSVLVMSTSPTKPYKRFLTWTSHKSQQKNTNGLSDTVVAQGTVPYLGTFLTDLMMVDTAFKDTTDDGLINFEKRRKEFEILMQIRLFQSAANQYQIQPNEKFIDWLANMPVFDDSVSYATSLEIEPEVSPASTPVKENQSKPIRSSFSYFSPRRFSAMPSVDHVILPSSSQAFFSTSRRTRAVHSFASLNSSPSPGQKHRKGLRHSSSVISLHSIDKEDLVSQSLRLDDRLIIRVYLDSLENGSTNYKSLLLNNSDHTKALLKKVFRKYNMQAETDDFQVFQKFSDGSELLLPDRGNVFYAINQAADIIEFIVRKRTELSEICPTKSKKKIPFTL